MRPRTYKSTCLISGVGNGSSSGSRQSSLLNPNKRRVSNRSWKDWWKLHGSFKNAGQNGIPFTGSNGDTGKSKSDRGERTKQQQQPTRKRRTRGRGRRMSEEEGRSKGGPQQYGTFQGAPNYAQPAIGFPQPVPPPGHTAAHPFPPPQQSGPAYYARGYHAVPGTPSVRLIACEKCFFFVNLLGSRYASMSSLFHA